MPIPEFKAVPRDNGYYSLRVTYPNSRLPGDGSSQFGRLRMERDGWNAHADADEDFGKALRAACHRAGRNSPIETVLAEIKKTYLDWHH